MTLSNLTPALESTMKSLEARIPNLHPKNRGRAEGIIRNIRDYNRATEKQVKEIVRLEKASKRKWKAKKPKVHIKENYTGHYDGHRWISAGEKASAARWQEAEDRARETMSPEEHETWRRDRYARSLERDRMNREDLERFTRRNIVLSYDRSRSLADALPWSENAATMQRGLAIKALIRRLRWMRDPKTRDGMTASERRHHINVIRACIAAEGLAVLRDRAQARLLQAAE